MTKYYLKPITNSNTVKLMSTDKPEYVIKLEKEIIYEDVLMYEVKGELLRCYHDVDNINNNKIAIIQYVVTYYSCLLKGIILIYTLYYDKNKENSKFYLELENDFDIKHIVELNEFTTFTDIITNYIINYVKTDEFIGHIAYGIKMRDCKRRNNKLYDYKPPLKFIDLDNINNKKENSTDSE